MDKKQGIKDKASKLVGDFRRHWNKPPDGYDMSYKEGASYIAGATNLNFISVLTYNTTLALSMPMMTAYFKVSSGLIFLLSIVGSILTLIRSPFLSMLFDNSGKKGNKFKPFILWTTIAVGISYGLIPFIPEAWVGISLFNIKIPEISMFKIGGGSVPVSLAVLVMFVLLQLGSVFNTILGQAFGGIEQTMSTVAQERAAVGSIKGIIASLPSSIIGIVMGAVATIAFSTKEISGMTDIRLYRIFFPICMAGAVALCFVFIRGIKERAVVKKEYVAKVNFFDGVREVSGNKYFWIITIFNVILGVRGLSNIVNWVCVYAIGGEAGSLALTICNIVVNFGLVPGMALSPLLIKAFGKRNVMLFSSVLFAGALALQLLLIRQSYIVLVLIFFQNLFGGFYLLPGMMASDALDYQQWKTGKRLEGFWQNYSAVISTVLGFIVLLLTPVFLAMGGLDFSAEVDDAFKNRSIMYGAFRYQTLFALIGSVICIIPMIFYNLSEKKHADIIKVLRIRAAVQNLKDGVLGNDDVKNVKAISKYAEDNKSVFIADELAKHAEINEILVKSGEIPQETA